MLKDILLKFIYCNRFFRMFEFISNTVLIKFKFNKND